MPSVGASSSVELPSSNKSIDISSRSINDSLLYDFFFVGLLLGASGSNDIPSNSVPTNGFVDMFNGFGNKILARYCIAFFLLDFLNLINLA